MDFQQRRDRLRRAVRKAGGDALLVTDFHNVTYLTGFTGDDSYLLLRQDGEALLTDFRYTTQLGEECPGLELLTRPAGVTMLKAVAKAARLANCGKLAIEGDSMTVSLRDRIAAEMPKVQLTTTTSLVEQFRQIKDKTEIARIRQAVWQAEKGFSVLRATLRPEKTEREVANELEHQMRLFGAKTSAFPTIVAAGPRAALPHATITDQQIGEQDILLVDWGADEGLYRSDLTRVLVTGKISPKLQRIYGVVLKAQTKAIAAMRPGVTGKEIDAIARGIIADAGYGRHFGHGLGHGVGLQIHEAPRLAANCNVVLKPGMVITVEPGIYLRDWGGVRIEDDVLITRGGHEVLTCVAKRLEEMVVT